MKHKGTETLESNRLLLRKFTVEDADLMYENWAKDEDVTQYLTWPAHRNTDETRSLLKHWVSQYKELDTYRWCIELKEDEVPIGSISVVSLDSRVESAEIGYCIGKSYWRNGLTTEAVQTVVSFLFDRVGINRVEAHIDPRNEGSGQVLVKSGFIYTGLRRQVAVNNRGICDIMTYELLNEDVLST